jgi:hypothetical protein
VFWSPVPGFAEDPDDPDEPGHQECLITSRDLSQLLLFITVLDGKKAKRLGLCREAVHMHTGLPRPHEPCD